jgi:nicotinamide-nucleotide amidase
MQNSPKGSAEIITIGDELLIGQVVNTNASWMAEQLSLFGIRLNRITAIRDSESDLHQILDEAVNRSQFILLTGGLGPTADDITKPALCSYFGTRLVFNIEAYGQIRKLFALRGLQVSNRNKEQAFLPENCKPIPNHNGTAPGMWFNSNNCYVVSMPGVPFEMKPMFTDYILPMISDLTENKVYIHKTIMTTGMGESWLADRISDWEKAIPENVRLAYLPQPGIVRLRLSAEGKDVTELHHQMNILVSQLVDIIPDLIFGYDEISLEEVVGQLLMQSKKTVATAESCTGGHIAHLLTGVPGSSQYFMGSLVAYDNAIKQQLLGVEKKLIKKHGAVSQQVVEAMATNARQLFDVDYALATSGIAGPGGGIVGKPVGTVWVALAKADGIISERFQFGEHRGRNIHRSALAALNMLRMAITGGSFT